MTYRRIALSCIAILLWQSAGLVEGQQVRHLPEVLPASEAFAEHQIDFLEAPDLQSDPFLPQQWLEPASPANPDRPPDARDGMFQKLTFRDTWLAGIGGDDSFGINDVELSTVLALPIPSRDFPLVVTPGFAVRYLDGPQVSDLPSRVYDAYTQFRWFRRYTPRWASDLAVSPGVYSDFEMGNDEALRITGHGIAIFDWTPTTRLAFGVAYLDRDDLRMLPAGGLIWKPNDEWEFRLVAPRPEIARRVYWSGFTGDRVQDWLYVAGEYGGGTWAIRRADGEPDTFTYSDFRALLGIQRKAIGSLDGLVEVGYVFGREIEYASPTADVKPSDTILLRAGLTY
ncbi:MAG: hypothetical protein GXY83_33405 [Rhodopirellula sp.]|nr:hypothetical protein [Rhodopirellula sp.]